MNIFLMNNMIDYIFEVNHGYFLRTGILKNGK